VKLNGRTLMSVGAVGLTLFMDWPRTGLECCQAQSHAGPWREISLERPGPPAIAQHQGCDTIQVPVSGARPFPSRVPAAKLSRNTRKVSPSGQPGFRAGRGSNVRSRGVSLPATSGVQTGAHGWRKKDREKARTRDTLEYLELRGAP
jgi:hypothetical protein